MTTEHDRDARRVAFEKWLDSDASDVMYPRSKFYDEPAQRLAFLAYQASLEAQAPLVAAARLAQSALPKALRLRKDYIGRMVAAQIPGWQNDDNDFQSIESALTALDAALKEIKL